MRCSAWLNSIAALFFFPSVFALRTSLLNALLPGKSTNLLTLLHYQAFYRVGDTLERAGGSGRQGGLA